MRLRILFLIASVALVGCQQRDRYQLIQATSDGGAYRLNKETGEVRLILGRQSFLVTEVEGEPQASAETPAQTSDEAWEVVDRP